MFQKWVPYPNLKTAFKTGFSSQILENGRKHKDRKV